MGWYIEKEEENACKEMKVLGKKHIFWSPDLDSSGCIFVGAQAMQRACCI